eukprot:Skav208064  [mRNA]  locus=scaffold936:63011:77170:- [translate_table: standard]
MAGFTTPVDDAASQPKRNLQDTIICCLIPFVVVFLSGSLIRTNQYLMKEEHFPYPFVLVISHCFFCSLFSLLLLWCQPKLFPALTDPEKKVTLSVSFYTHSILPISLCFAVSLVLSNMAYMYCTVAFLQMIKQGCLVILMYIMSMIAGLESFSFTQVAILSVLLCATISCIEGELHFSLLGFLVQFSASTFEAAKTIFTALILSGKGQKLDPLSTVLVVMPVTGVVLYMVVLFNNLVVTLGFVPQPTWEDVYEWRGMLMINIINAFALNVSIAVFLKYLAPMTYIFVGNIKDILVVCMSAWMIHEAISKMQVVGFSIQICCALSWSSYKHYGKIVPPDLPSRLLQLVRGSESKES